MENEGVKLTWEERRAYLAHSLFQDVSMASFVTEDDMPLPVALEPCSPLPELNVEVIPNRHDEPEEFYQELDTKMQKYYRKLFCNEDCCTEEELDELKRLALDPQSPNLECTRLIPSQREEADQMDLEDDDGENKDDKQANGVYEEMYHPHVVTPATNTESPQKLAGDHTDSFLEFLFSCGSVCESPDLIMRSDNVRRHSMYSVSLTGHSSGSSQINVDFTRSKSFDFDLDLLQVSTLSNPTKMQDTSQNDKHKNDSDSLHNKSMDQNDGDEHAERSEESSKSLVEGFVRMTSTQKSKSTSDVCNDSNPISDKDESEYVDDKHEDVTSIKKIIDSAIDNKAGTTDDLNRKSGSSNDEYVTFEEDEYVTFENTISNPDMDVGKTPADKATTGGVSKKISKDSEDKSFPLDKVADKMERKCFVSATSTPKSNQNRTTITKSALEETGSLDDLNTARISSSSSTRGTKRALQEISQEDVREKYKKPKLIDVGVQTTDDNLNWNHLKNSLCVGDCRIYKLCRCEHHICDC